MSPLEGAVSLARLLGDPALDLAILAEGNTSASEADGTFWVKASGHTMRDCGPAAFVRVASAPVRQALESDADDAAVRDLLRTVTVDADAPLPSVETFMHAELLALPGVAYVAHCHPTPLLALLSLEGCEAFARQRLFPDEIVCCGPATAFVPYVDPGLPLARAVRQAALDYLAEEGAAPKTMWLQNHGLIALGATVREAESATLMAAKAARAWLGALQTGRPLRPLSETNVARIHTRPDEHYRQRLLRGTESSPTG